MGALCRTGAVAQLNCHPWVLLRCSEPLDDAFMQSEKIIAGQWIPQEEPDWTGLEALLPILLCGPFMWMGVVQLEHGTTLGAYKHHTTRRYLHLDNEGATYAYRGPAGYCRVRHHDAIEHVFDPSWILRCASEDEKRAVMDALDEAVKRDEADSEAGRSLPACRI